MRYLRWREAGVIDGLVESGADRVRLEWEGGGEERGEEGRR